MGAEGTLSVVHEDEAQGMKVMPLSQLYRKVLGEVPRLVPLTHTSCFVWTLDHVLRIAIKPGVG